MSGPILTFADLLAPVRPETFFEQHWENKPLHIQRSESSFYDNLLTNGDVEAAISSGGLRYPAIQLAKDGGFFSAEAITRNIRSGDDIFTGVPNLDRVRAEYQSGATISLPAFHRAWQPLGVLAAAIEDGFDHPVHTNVYITPGNASGFTPHYDTHEVFVLQIAGGKRWRIHKPPLSLPHRSQPFDPRSYVSSAPLSEVALAPGDLLYLPRGFVHTTSNSNSFSVHVTLGVTVFTWVEVFVDWIQSSKNCLSFRRALPPGFAKTRRCQAIAQGSTSADHHGTSTDDRLRCAVGRLFASGSVCPTWNAS
jgi:JmjC domain